MATSRARGFVRIVLVLLTVWLAGSGSAIAQGAPPAPTDLEAIQTSASEITLSFLPGEGGGPIAKYYITADGRLFETVTNSVVLGGLIPGDYTIEIYAQGPPDDLFDSSIVQIQGTVLPVAGLLFGPIPSKSFGDPLDLSATGVTQVTNAASTTFTSQTPAVCGVSGADLVYVAVGACTLTANASADPGYFPPEPVSATFQIDAVEPAAPTSVVAVAGDGSATVSYDAPDFDGGSPIDYYEATSSPEDMVFLSTGAALSIPAGTLTNGTAYSFTVRAHNAQGFSTPSNASAEVTPRGGQTITFANPGPQAFGTTPTLTATTTASGLDVTFSSTTSAVCTVSMAGTLNFLTLGSCSISADQAGNAAYTPAPTVSQTFTVQGAAPDAPTAVTAVASDGSVEVSFTPPAVTGSSAIVSYTVTGNPGGSATGTASPITVSSLTNGTPYTFTVTATNSQDTGAASTPSDPVTPKGGQTITFATNSQVFGASPQLNATASSGLEVSYTSDTTGVCTVTPTGTLTFVTAGTCTITAAQAGSAAFLAAIPVSNTFNVNAVVPGAPTIGSATPGDASASVSFSPPSSTGGAAITVYTVTSSPGGFNGTGSSSPILVNGLTNGTAYTFTVTAQNSAGEGDPSGATGSVTPKAAQTITFANPGTGTFGTSPTLAAAATSGLPVVFSSSTPGICTITNSGTLAFVSVGTCTINADQAGDGAWLAATQQTQSFTVAAVAAGAPTDVSAVVGDTSATVSFTAPTFTGGSAITSYTVTSSPGGVTATGGGSPIAVNGLTNGIGYTFTVTATTAAGPGAISDASNSVTPRATQTITFNQPSAQNFGTTPTFSATADSGLTPVFTSSTTGVCSITSTGTLAFLTAGNCTINADQSGNSSYLPAPTVSQTFAVNAVAPGAPTTLSVVFGDGQATVYFDTASGGGAAVTYTVTSSPGSITQTGSSSPITVSGLTNGTSYSFTVTANNGSGSATSTPSTSGSPLGPQTISFTATAQQQVGTPANLAATASSGLPVSFSSETPMICTVSSGGALTLLAPGTCTIRASQGGGSGYAAATPVDQSFTVVAAAPVAVIPTLTEWAMMMLGLVLAGGATLVIRRRSQVA